MSLRASLQSCLKKLPVSDCSITLRWTVSRAFELSGISKCLQNSKNWGNSIAIFLFCISSNVTAFLPAVCPITLEKWVKIMLRAFSRVWSLLTPTSCLIFLEGCTGGDLFKFFGGSPYFDLTLEYFLGWFKFLLGGLAFWVVWLILLW